MSAPMIWRNGELINWEDATVHVTSHALHYGSSVFEGIRAYATESGPAIFRLEAHTRRMMKSCKIAKIELPYSEDEINQAIIETVGVNQHESCYIRPLVMRGAGDWPSGLEGRGCPTEVIIITKEWATYLGPEALEKGADVQVSSWRRMAPDTHPSLAKIGGNYVNSQMMKMEAIDNGFKEGIGLDIYGYVSEGSGENIFAVLDGVVYTPGSWASILLGITRDSVLTLLEDLGYEVRFQPIAREMLYMADEIFFTGTAAEVTPIRSVDRIPVGSGSRGPITKRVQEEFFALTSGAKPDRHNWLTHVRQKVSEK